MVKVRIPTPLRPLTKGQGEVQAKGANITEMIEGLNTAHPGLKDRLCRLQAGETQNHCEIARHRQSGGRLLRLKSHGREQRRDGDRVRR